MTWVLHASDPHLGKTSPGQALDDDKLEIAREDLETTQEVFRRTLDGLADFVAIHGRPAAAVFSGDLDYQASSGGFAAFARLLIDAKPLLPTSRKKIIVVPGNHDVVWGTPPGSLERYEGFLGATRDRGCVTPLLDGIDFSSKESEKVALADDLDTSRHVVVGDDFIVVPFNSSNYCGTTPEPRRGYKDADWAKAVKRVAELEDQAQAAAGNGSSAGSTLAAELEREVARLRQHDIARVSRRQLKAVDLLLQRAGIASERPTDDYRLRIAVLHHQLLPVSTREEWKTFESIINLGLLRERLVTFGFDVVLHGHKHAGHIYWDHATAAAQLHRPDRRMLVVAGPGHFEVGKPVLRALILEGPATARNLRVRTFRGIDAGGGAPASDDDLIAVWRARMDASDGRTSVIRGSDLHEVYSRLCAHFEQRGLASRRNVVCEIASSELAGILPPDYPATGRDDAQMWFEQIVGWWQQERSALVPDVLPFNHGERIYTHWGNQVQRAARSLDERGDSSRSLITLISPDETGRYENDPRPKHNGTYPAFAMVEFTIAERKNRHWLDCTATFRKQEMRYWWPINIAELAQLQAAVIEQMTIKPKPAPGAIVTLSTIAIYGTSLPRVAVLELDRLIEEPTQLWDLARAIADPATATDQTRATWRHLLEELGRDPGDPPVPRVGHHELLDALSRAIELRPSPKATTARNRLADLCDLYDAIGAKPTPHAASLIDKARRKFVRAVSPLLKTGPAGP